MTSHSTVPHQHSPGTYRPREPLRLKLSRSPGTSSLDGGWWPQSRDLGFELADLVDNLPVDIGRVQRVLYSHPDWDTSSGSVHVETGRIKVSSFPNEDNNMVLLRTSTRSDLRLLVVPPDHPVGRQAMRVAANPTNRWSTVQILAAGAFDEEDSDADEHWTDKGDSWWPQPEAGPPSFR